MKQIKNSDDVFSLVKNDYLDFQEVFILIGVNAKNTVLFKDVLFKGGVSECIIDIKIIFKTLLMHNCTGFFIAHNHPSGDVAPSIEDDTVTKKIKDASKLLEFRFLDHLVFTDKKFYSYSDEDKL